MPESTNALNELQRLRLDVDDLKAITGALLHAQPDLPQRVLAKLRSDPTLTRALLLVDGQKSQNDILVVLKAERYKGASKRGVSERFKYLSEDLGLIAFDRREKNGSIYRRTALDAALKTSQTLEREARSGR
jgi:hypothetical protein